MTTMDPIDDRWNARAGHAGSALILTVVLTSLLAIVGVLFLMSARLDKMATSATVDNRQLGFAVDSVVAQIKEVLAADVPGSSPPDKCYDYPDANNPWLADLEPYPVAVAAKSPSTIKTFEYRWGQISNITGRLIGSTNGVRALTVGEREPIDTSRASANADADGDGVGDAQWFLVPGLVSSKGKPLYAAVRVVDNGGMLNVNTGYKFNSEDPNGLHVDGRNQLQVNLLALARGPGDRPTTQDEASLLGTRANDNKMPAFTVDLNAYALLEIWQYQWPNAVYTPFDLSDELELRYRYLLNQKDVDTRVENWGWFKPLTAITTPVESNAQEMDYWYLRAAGIDPNVPIDPNTKPGVTPPNFAFDSRYAYRHIATTYNLDRIRAPRPVSGPPDAYKMVNVNTADRTRIEGAVTAALEGINLGDTDMAQIIANIVDYIDDDSDVTVVRGTATTSAYYGFERPCIYLSELAYRFVRDTNTNLVHKSYAVELCRPYFEDRDPRPGEWRLLLGNGVSQVVTWSGTRQFHVLLYEDADAPLKSDYVSFKDLVVPVDPASVPGYNATDYSNPSTQTLDSAGFSDGTIIQLQRKVTWGGRDDWVTVDLKTVPADFMVNAEDGTVHRLQRDISLEGCILRLWGPAASSAASLGNAEDSYVSTDSRKVQAHPANQTLTNIGELSKIFAHSAYNLSESDVNAFSAETLLINPANRAYENLFNYLTVMDPENRGINLVSGETRVKGRININTAPIFVLAQLPWMTGYQETVPFERARAIVNYRNIHHAFKSIAGLMLVPQMGKLASDGVNNLFDAASGVPRGPDLTADNITDDAEERDLIFTRISDLVTVRSDVFTAYILVRIGIDGPQKRVVAIFDRGLTTGRTDPVRILSLEQAPDPR